MTRFLLALLLTLAALPARAADPLTLMLDWFVNPDHGPIIVAAKRGYFAAEGLEVEIIAPADPADPPRLVAAGRADLAVSYQPQLYLQHAAGLGLKRVGTLIDTPLACVMVDAAGPVKSMADLKGRSAGFSLAGVEEALLHRMLQTNGVDPADVAQINVNFALTPALVTGQVDAVSGAFRNFEPLQMAAAGHVARCFLPEENGVPPYDELIYVARARDDRIDRFLRATARAAAEIAADPEAGWEEFRRYAPELDDDLNAQAWGATWPHFARDPVALDAARYEGFGRFMAEMGLIETSPKLADIVAGK